MRSIDRVCDEDLVVLILSLSLLVSGFFFPNPAQAQLTPAQNQLLCRQAVIPEKQTFKRFSKPIPPENSAEEFLLHINNWLPERQTQQRSWQQHYMREIKALSAHIEAGKPFTEPLLILTRGNSGSGKTYFLKNGNHPLIQRLKLQEHLALSEEGIINPDPIKALIQKTDPLRETSAQDAHEEGSIIAKRLVDEALSQSLSLIIDKRFLTLRSLKATVDAAKSAGYRVVMFDLDVALEISLGRVGFRPIGGESPNVPYDPIEEGYAQARAHRLEIADYKGVDEYYLVSDNQIVAQRINDNAVAVLNPSLWQRSILPPSETELTGYQSLYKSLLDYLSQSVPSDLLRPFDGDVKSSGQHFVPTIQDTFSHPAGNAIKYHLYQIRKHGDSEEHRKLMHALKSYFESTFANVKIDFEFIPAQKARMADGRLTLTTENGDLARRLLQDPVWIPTLRPDSGTTQIALIYSTRRVGKRQTGISYVDYDDVEVTMPGEAPAEPGLSAKHFIFLGFSTGRFSGKIPDVRVNSNTGIRFSTPYADAHHNYSFHAKQLAASLLSAQVENFLFKNTQNRSDENFQLYLKEAEQYLAVLQTAVDASVPGLNLEGPDAQSSLLKSWLASSWESFRNLKER